MPRFEGIDQSGFVDERAARHVDDNGSRGEQGELGRPDQLLRFGRVGSRQYDVLGAAEGRVELIERVEGLEVKRSGLDPGHTTLHADGPHSESPRHASHFLPNRAYPHDGETPIRQIARGEAHPPTFSLIGKHLRDLPPEHENGHQGVLGQRYRMDPTGRREHRCGHSLRISMSGHELADAGAGRLDPPKRGRELGQVLQVSSVEIEQHLRLGEQRHPTPLVPLRTLERMPDMVRCIAGRRKQARLVHDLEAWIHRADPIHMVRLQIAGYQDPHAPSGFTLRDLTHQEAPGSGAP